MGNLRVLLASARSASLEAPEATYFITFRCRRGLSLNDAARDAVLAAIRCWNGRRIDLDAAVVMPDHVHAIFRILDGAGLGEVLHSIRSFSANRVNRMLGREGSLGLDESFDHIIRQQIEWEEKIEYIRNNPVKRELVELPEDYRWLYIRG